MVPSGRCVQDVIPYGVLVQISQYFDAGMTLIFERDAGILHLFAHGLGSGLMPGAIGVADIDGDSQAVLKAGLFEELPGRRDISLQRRQQRRIVRMDRRHMMVLPDIAAGRKNQLPDGIIINRFDDCLAHPLVGERLLVHLHAAGDRLRRSRDFDFAVKRFGEIHLLDRELVDAVHIA